MNLATLPPGEKFLDRIAERWLAQGDDLANGLILLPTRRAARALAEAFLRAGNGRPLLLPRITALGGIDEAPLTLAGALDLAPAVAPAQRLAALSRLILALPEAQGGVRSADRAWMLARELARLMDEAERAEIDLPSALAHVAGAEHAAHWQITLDFLAIVTRAWPAWLADQGLLNPADRQVRLLRAQARAWQDDPPAMPVWIAGTTGGIPAVAALLKTVARLSTGLVILPGLDHDLPEAAWEALGPSHPQHGLRRLLDDLGATRGDVAAWATPGPRGRLLAKALLPAAALDTWQTSENLETGGLFRLTPSDQQSEAAAIALILRDALETPGNTAALVTPDRGLAGRVAAELLRWGIVADDSAGEQLADTPPAVFLRLLAQAVAEDFSPIPLLALLKHPLAAAGLTPARCRAEARTLELSQYRGPRPASGWANLRRRAADSAFVQRLQEAIEPLLRIDADLDTAPSVMLAALIEAGERLATTDEAAGPARLWSLEEGEALAVHLTEALTAFDQLPHQPPAVLPGLLDALLEDAVVRSRRALRGRDAGTEHPRIQIWGLLESRLQSADVIVLGGLAETVWPPATDPGPWLSRPMRTAAGLPDPEEQIGHAAHDFVSAACAAPIAILSCPARRDHAPAVPARWLARLDACLAGHRRTLQSHPAAAWATRLDHPVKPTPVRPPQPRPALHLRPRSLSVTEIQTWLEDPFAIYARHILRLKPLRPIEEETDAADYGSVVHNGMQFFLAEFGPSWPPDAAGHLRRAMDRALAEQELRPALTAWWAPRLGRIADWIAEHETGRRSVDPPVEIGSERTGQWTIPTPRPFVLRGRADRIERRSDGTLTILDYKTGQPPSQAEVEAGFAPQLPLEAAMAAHGGFGTEWRGQAVELTYWHLTGGHEPGAERRIHKRDPDALAAAIVTAEEKLKALIIGFDALTRAYLAQPQPGRTPRFPEYAQLARVAEWSAGEDA